MQANPRITEVSGRPVKVWGNVLVPAAGSVTLKILGDTLQSTVKSGMEQTDSWVRIQNVDTVEVAEAPEYLLIVLGIFLLFIGLGLWSQNFFFGFLFFVAGIACIVYAFINKRRLLVIHSLRSTVAVFMTKPSSSYQQFAEHVMAIARHLNAPPTMPPTNRPTNNRPPMPPTSGQRTAI
ncbi:hypothetical protein ACN4EK_24340 [Pantanalinema rosaneae CENA516]|uniref:hypothetical protein n=1 Tax=Pantanalinema rosaneae TaxID=1620701 RepID=UPI003D6E4ED3